MRMVICSVLKIEAEGLDDIPFPGELGKRIYDSVSKQGWDEWLKRLTTIINENGISTADPASIEVIEILTYFPISKPLLTRLKYRLSKSSLVE